MKFFLIKGLSRGLDGLVVEGDWIDSVESDVGTQDILAVMRIVDRDSMFGDRVGSVPVEPGLYISSEYLFETEDPTKMEFDSKSSYGEFQLEGTMECDGVKVAYAQYERVLQLSILDTVAGKTLYTENFSKQFDLVKRVSEESLKESTVEDLVFKLSEIKESERGP